MIFNCFPLPKERFGCKQNSEKINFVVVENHEFIDQDKSKILEFFGTFGLTTFRCQEQKD